MSMNVNSQLEKYEDKVKVLPGQAIRAGVKGLKTISRHPGLYDFHEH